MTNDNLQLTILIQGRVQGVFFRRGVKSQADKLGLVGCVRNFVDGGVHVVAQGKRVELQKLLDWCYRGSDFANVESLKFSWEKAEGEFSGFKILRQGNFLEDKIAAIKNLSRKLIGNILIPKHVAIIPDGNRRWARSHKLTIFRGHEQGIENVENLMEESLELKIPYLTLWGFSTENWTRPKREIDFLMNLSRRYLKQLKEKLLNYKVQFRHFGRKDRLPIDILESLDRLESETKTFSEGHFGLAFDYGGRDEILRALSKIKDKEVSEATFNQALDTKGFPDPDLIIRTSGEQRLSGFMPWQGTYAELYFTPVLFPDFGIPEFRKALVEFGNRKRNFGF